MKAMILPGLALALLTSGCASINGDYWSRKGATQESLDRDGSICAGFARIEAKKNFLFDRSSGKVKEFKRCMGEKGYTLREFTPRQRAEINGLKASHRERYVQALMAEARMGRQVIVIPADPVALSY